MNLQQQQQQREKSNLIFLKPRKRGAEINGILR